MDLCTACRDLRLGQGLILSGYTSLADHGYQNRTFAVLDTIIKRPFVNAGSIGFPCLPEKNIPCFLGLWATRAHSGPMAGVLVHFRHRRGPSLKTRHQKSPE